jgi:hypothetical protein
MPINHTQKILFVHVPKCAGTTIERLMGVSAKEHLYSDFVALEDTRKLPLTKFTDKEFMICAAKNMQHYTYREICKVLTEEALREYFKFSVVRNPYDRLVSEYHFSRGSIKIHSTFKDVVDSLALEEHIRNWMYDGHLETQTSFLLNEAGNFDSLDKIYKFENLAECFRDLRQRTGNLKEYHLRKSTDRQSYETYYTPELKSLVYNFYKEDFDNFGYSQ